MSLGILPNFGRGSRGRTRKHFSPNGRRAGMLVCGEDPYCYDIVDMVTDTDVFDHFGGMTAAAVSRGTIEALRSVQSQGEHGTLVTDGNPNVFCEKTDAGERVVIFRRDLVAKRWTEQLCVHPGGSPWSGSSGRVFSAVPLLQTT